MVTVRIIITSILLLNQDFLYFCQKAHQPQDCLLLDLCLYLCSSIFCISAEDLCFDRATRLFTPQSIRFHGQERTAATDSKATEASFLFGFVRHLVSVFWIFIQVYLHLSKFIFLSTPQSICLQKKSTAAIYKCCRNIISKQECNTVSKKATVSGT